MARGFRFPGYDTATQHWQQISLPCRDDPDNTDSDTEIISRPATDQPQGDASSAGSGTEYFDVQDDVFYFQAKADQPPREPWDTQPLDFDDLGHIFSIIHQLDESFRATQDISNPLEMEPDATRSAYIPYANG